MTRRVVSQISPSVHGTKNARLSTRNVQILFADLQPSLIIGSRTQKPETLAASAATLAKAARILEIPMIFGVVPESSNPARVIPELAEFSTDANIFLRTSASPFLDQPTASAIAANGRKVLVISGFSTEVAVLHAGLDAVEAGYAVQVPMDAIGGRSDRTEAAALRQIEHAGGITTSVLSLITILEPDFSRPPGCQTLEVLKALRSS